MPPFSADTTRLLSRRQFLSLLMLAGGCALPHTAPAPPAPPAHSAGSLPTVAAATRAAPTAAATPTLTSVVPAAASFDGSRAYAHAEAQMRYVPRHPGTEGWRACGDYILASFAAAGWQTQEQPFSYMGIECRNLIASRGSGPLLIIGAHYDTRRKADHDPDPQRRDEPVPGANDGASGVAVLLELAHVVQPESLGRTIWLAAFDAEDNGNLDGWDWIIGSRYMAETLTTTPQGMVLVDMIGDADQQIHYEYNSHPAMSQAIWQAGAEQGYNDAFIPTYRHSMIDDHIPFIEAGIPAVDLIDFDYPYWHTTADTLDKVSPASLEAVGRTLESWLLRDAPGMPALVSSLYLPIVTCAHGCQQRAAAANETGGTIR